MATKTTRRANLALKLGVAPTALVAAVGMDKADTESLKVWNTAMDAEEDAAEGDTAPKGQTLEEITAVITAAAKPLAELQTALASIASGGNVEDPDGSLDDEMEPVVDAQGQQVMENGKPKMQKKAAPAASADAMGQAPALGIAACDAAINSIAAQSAIIHTTLAGRAAPATLTAMDAGIERARTTRNRIVRKLSTKTPKGTGMDTAEIKTALDGLADTVKGLTTNAPTMKGVMGEIASRDKLANRVSAFTGTFDHSEMTTVDVAVYAAKKFGLDAAPETAVARVESYLHDRQPTAAAKPLSAFGMDAAPAASASTKYVSDFVAGRPAA